MLPTNLDICSFIVCIFLNVHLGYTEEEGNVKFMTKINEIGKYQMTSCGKEFFLANIKLAVKVSMY